MGLLKKARNLGLGAFFMSVSWPLWAACSVDVSSLEAATVERVSDGDTLRLKGGVKLRVIGLNTPELARKNRPAEPLAQEAKSAAERFLGKTVYLADGVDSRDRYGRRLAHVYREDGESLAAHLLEQGLAWQVVVPANEGQWRCYTDQQDIARRAKRGIWSQPPLQVASITPKDAGFRVVQGRVVSVAESRHHWWLNMGQLAVSVSKKDLSYFEQQGSLPDWRALQGKTLTLKGWVVDRSDKKWVKAKGYAPMTMAFRHPSMRLE